MRWCLLRWPLQLHGVAIRVFYVDGWSESLGAVAARGGWRLYTASAQMRTYRGLIELRQPQAKMVQIAPLGSGRSTTLSAQFTIDGNNIYKRGTGPELDESEFNHLALNAAPEHSAVKRLQTARIRSAQHDMIQSTYINSFCHDGATFASNHGA